MVCLVFVMHKNTPTSLKGEGEKSSTKKRLKSVDFETLCFPSPIQTFTVGFGVSPNPPFSFHRNRVTD